MIVHLIGLLATKHDFRGIMLHFRATQHGLARSAVKPDRDRPFTHWLSAIVLPMRPSRHHCLSFVLGAFEFFNELLLGTVDPKF